MNLKKQKTNPKLRQFIQIKGIIMKIYNSKNIKNITINKKVNQQTENIVQQLSLGKSYWKLFVVLSLLFLLIEILLIKYLKS